MRSGLGQSLRVEIPYRLAGNEQLTPACVALVPAQPGQALPTYSRANRVAITPTHIEIRGNSRVLEPLIGLIVEVRCATTPHFVRSYELFVDPPARIPAILSNGPQLAAARDEAATSTAIPVAGGRPTTLDARNETFSNGSGAATPSVPGAARANVSARARGQTGGALSQGQTYRVVRGDTLSGIAARIADRPITIREAAQAIFTSNRDAFARGNPDLLQAGHSLTIPVLAATAAPPAAAPLPVVRTAEPVPGTPSADLTSAPTAASPPAAAAIAATPAPPVAAVSVGEPIPAPPPEASSLWLTLLLALGAALALSTPLLFLRRRKPEAAPQPSAAAVRQSPPRRLVDPVAGFHVIEGRLPSVTPDSSGLAAPEKPAEAPPARAASALAAQPEPLPIEVGPVTSVDLDVGTPVVVDERVDWFADAPVAAPDAALDDTATVQAHELANGVDVEQPLERKADVFGQAKDDEQHTMTIVELEMLRQDYEAEHTLTHAANKELRDAVADLKATQAARAASAETATLEIPQAESIETQPTQRLRSSR